MRKLKKTDPFQIEYQRADLASEGNLDNLIKMYSTNYPEIPNLNTSSLWDELNMIDITEKTNPMAWDRVNQVASWLKDGNLVLNVGFGSGIVEELAVRKYRDIELYGIDISKRSVVNAQKKFGKDHFSIGTIEKLPYKDNTFDYVLALEVLEHLSPSKILKSLEEVNRVLKNKGFFIVSVPLNEGLDEMIRRGINPNAHVRIYTPDLIKAELQIAGFKIIRERYLYAFHSMYKLKSLFCSIVPKLRKANNIIIEAIKA